MIYRPRKMIKLAFFGTPELTTAILDSLKAQNLSPALIVTTPDKPKGRKLVLTPPPAKVWADKNKIPCLQPEKLDESFVEKMTKENFDLFVVAAYGKIFPDKLINSAKFGTLNIHYSLLPKYRGASPIESAILNGDAETGVSIQKMQLKLDSGPIVASEKFSVPKDVTAPDLRDALNSIAAKILPKVILEYVSGKIITVSQDDKLASNCKKINKEDGLIDLAGDDILNDRKFRAYFDWPRTYFFDKDTRVIVSDAKLENGVFKIKKVIPEGKKETLFEVFRKNSGE